MASLNKRGIKSPPVGCTKAGNHTKRIIPSPGNSVKQWFLILCGAVTLIVLSIVSYSRTIDVTADRGNFNSWEAISLKEGDTRDIEILQEQNVVLAPQVADLSTQLSATSSLPDDMPAPRDTPHSSSTPPSGRKSPGDLRMGMTHSSSPTPINANPIAKNTASFRHELRAANAEARSLISHTASPSSNNPRGLTDDKSSPVDGWNDGVKELRSVLIYQEANCEGGVLASICKTYDTCTRRKGSGIGSGVWVPYVSIFVPPGTQVGGVGCQRGRTTNTTFTAVVPWGVGGTCFNIPESTKKLSVDYDVLLEVGSRYPSCSPSNCYALEGGGMLNLDSASHAFVHYNPRTFQPHQPPQCEWRMMEWSQSQVKVLDEDPLIPARYKLMFKNKSSWPGSDKEAANAFTCPPEESRVSYPDQRNALTRDKFVEGKGEAIMWFEHMQKAGGTSFCKWARENEGKLRLPPTYCMIDRKGRLRNIPEGTLYDMMKSGTGTNTHGSGSPQLQPKALGGYSVTANEWDPFPYQRLDTMVNRTLFATVMREPVERIMSHYNFFHVDSATAQNQKTGNIHPFAEFIDAGEYNNYYTRKLTDRNFKKDVVINWNHLELAKKVLQRFTLVIILEFLDMGAPSFDYIGWKLPSKKVLPQTSMGAQTVKQYRSSWEQEHQEVVRDVFTRNYFDLLLYDFALQLYFERNNQCFGM